MQHHVPLSMRNENNDNMAISRGVGTQTEKYRNWKKIHACAKIGTRCARRT